MQPERVPIPLRIHFQHSQPRQNRLCAPKPRGEDPDFRDCPAPNDWTMPRAVLPPSDSAQVRCSTCLWINGLAQATTRRQRSLYSFSLGFCIIERGLSSSSSRLYPRWFAIVCNSIHAENKSMNQTGVANLLLFGCRLMSGIATTCIGNAVLEDGARNIFT